jgi:hypothetical protein
MSIACLLSLSTAVHDGRKTAISLNGLPSRWTYTPPRQSPVLTPPDPGGPVSVSVSFTAVHHCSRLTAPAASVQVADGDEPP